MKKLNFLAICLLSLLSFSSCSKDVNETGGTTPVVTENQSNATISYSRWISSSMLTWTDTTINGNPAIHATFHAPLTESMISNSSILVYARKTDTEETSVFPATMYDNNNDYELLHATTDLSGIQIFHTKNTGGIFERPENNTLRFRYILIDQPVPANGRPDMASTPQYNMAELQTMLYTDVLTTLGVPEE